MIRIVFKDPTMLKILCFWFPRKLYAPRFNKYLKLVLKEAGIHQMVKGCKFNPDTHLDEYDGAHPRGNFCNIGRDLNRDALADRFMEGGQQINASKSTA